MISINRFQVFCVCLLVGALGASTTALGETNEDAAAQANNPLANFRAFNVHNYYVPELSELDDQNANSFWLRYAQPVGNWLVRASLPTLRVPTGMSETKSGLGDLNVFAARLIDTGNPAVSFGVGPNLTFPTATEDETGADKWQAGLAAVYFNATSKRVQWGGLVTWQTDYAGDDDRADTEVLALQPFYLLQLGEGKYVRSTAIAVFNLETNDYNVPIGLGFGKVVPAGNTIYNIFIEPQFTVLDRGPGQPELQVFAGFNTQFK